MIGVSLARGRGEVVTKNQVSGNYARTEEIPFLIGVRGRLLEARASKRSHSDHEGTHRVLRVSIRLLVKVGDFVPKI